MTLVCLQRVALGLGAAFVMAASACLSGKLDAITLREDIGGLGGVGGGGVDVQPDAAPPIDAGVPDSEPPDGDLPDGTPPPPDTGPPDTGPPDTGPPDTGPPDTGPPDTGPPDADGGDIVIIPPGAYCVRVADWPRENEQIELALLAALRAWRQKTKACSGSEQPLYVSPELWCTARRHALDMATRDFFDSQNPDGQGPPERMKSVGLKVSSMWAELLDRSTGSPEDVIAELLSQHPTPCPPILDATYRRIGIGQYNQYWVLDLLPE